MAGTDSTAYGSGVYAGSTAGSVAAAIEMYNTIVADYDGTVGDFYAAPRNILLSWVWNILSHLRSSSTVATAT